MLHTHDIMFDGNRVIHPKYVDGWYRGKRRWMRTIEKIETFISLLKERESSYSDRMPHVFYYEITFPQEHKLINGRYNRVHGTATYFWTAL